VPDSGRPLYFDCFSGAAGNMLLGALLDVGLSARRLREALAALGVRELRLRASIVQRGPIRARYVSFAAPRRHEHGRSYPSIRRLIDRARLPAAVRRRAAAVFARLAEAEGRVHGVPAARVHFHEIGGLDSIGDVVGVCAALELLQVGRVTASPLPLGRGVVDTEHGPLPHPAPATLELLRGVPTVPYDVPWETVTPTGAALLAEIAAEFAPMPPLTPRAQGFGAGNDRRGPLPNVLRAVLGEASSAFETDRVAVLETHLDDMSPEHLPFLLERLLEDGALDAALAPLAMKKGRPGLLLRVLARPEDADRLARRVLLDSTALGVRVALVGRLKLPRESRSVRTAYGRVRVKLAQVPGGRPIARPEYEDCARAARRHEVPLAEVYRAAERAAEREKR
jgi:hypothetical protein